MQWHLDFNPLALPEKFGYGKPIVMTGSCFAEEIGAIMVSHKFDVCLNPNGIVFNPWSIINYLQRVLTGKLYVEDELVEHEGLWHSWDHHGSFSGVEKDAVLNNINDRFSSAGKYLLKADWLIVTLGSAHAYLLNESNRVVANCHKIPSSAFSKKLLPVDVIITTFDNFIYQWRHFNPNGKMLLTVSPVRYNKDGLVENNLSKAILLQSVHHLVNKYPNTYYFPAYELVIDILRDYRFYKEDLVHPNHQAIEFVWQHFVKACLDDEALKLLPLIHKIVQAASHRPLHMGTKEHVKFVESTVGNIMDMQSVYPFLNFEDEINLLESKSL